MKSLKQTIMDRDGISADEADDLIEEATDTLHSYIESGDSEAAENICEEYFGLEPDFLLDMI